MKTLLCALLCLPLVSQPQTGIYFDKESNWQQIQQKARQENKFIFVDCYTTWCGPCKTMSEIIFKSEELGAFANDKFVSIQVQMDTTAKDSKWTKDWYGDAHLLMNNYKVSAFPTYLFFSPDGKIVHKEVGAMNNKDFLEVLRSALVESKQFYTLLERYEHGFRDYTTMADLSKKAKRLGDDAMASKIAKDYSENYLDKLPNEKFATKENLTFFNDFYDVLTLRSKAFQFYLKHSDIVDSALEDPGYSQRMVDYIVYAEEVHPWIKRMKAARSHPDWKYLRSLLEKKYNPAVAGRVVVNTQVQWYRDEKDWKNYSRCLVKQMDLKDLKNLPVNVGSVLLLNNTAWDVFLHSSNKAELKKALTWIDFAIPMDTVNPSAMLDTKANILYKMGRVREAIAVQETALRYEPDAEGLLKNLRKMKEGKPTWEE